jgi:putative ABC transport system permease protein
MMDSLVQDLRFAVRSFVRAPRFTIPAVLALALGIGATSATFSVIRGVLLEPLPYRDPDRIVVVWENNLKRNRPRNVIAAANFVEWRERNRSFSHLGAAGQARLNFMLDNQPEEVSGVVASSDVFPALGVQPALGRPYTAAEDEEGRDAVMVVSHEFWQTRLGGRADVLGSTMQTSGRLRTIVGVMPPGFTVIGEKADFMIPYGWTMEQLRSSPGRGSSHGIARSRWNRRPATCRPSPRSSSRRCRGGTPAGR